MTHALLGGWRSQRLTVMVHGEQLWSCRAAPLSRLACQPRATATQHPPRCNAPVVTFPSIPVVGRSGPAPALHTPPAELRDAATHQQQPLADDGEDIVIDLTGDE